MIAKSAIGIYHAIIMAENPGGHAGYCSGGVWVPPCQKHRCKPFFLYISSCQPG
jgi:hypothetical protein